MRQMRMLLRSRFDFSPRLLVQRQMTVLSNSEHSLSWSKRVSLLSRDSSSRSDPRELLKLKCRRMLVKNDGQAFREEDWQRLKRIAEGNPDETKIGIYARYTTDLLSF